MFVCLVGWLVVVFKFILVLRLHMKRDYQTKIKKMITHPVIIIIIIIITTTIIIKFK